MAASRDSLCRGGERGRQQKVDKPKALPPTSDYAQYYAHPVHGEGVTACYVRCPPRQQTAIGEERVATGNNRYAHG
jgi:hypothetical protein